MDPWLQIWLGTSRYLPNEALVCSVTTFSGFPKVSPDAPAQLSLRLTSDSSAQDALWLYYSAGLGNATAPPVRPASVLLTLKHEVASSASAWYNRNELQAPAAPGEYRLEAVLKTADGRSAEGSVPFEVMSQVKRLLVRIPPPQAAGAGGKSHIDIPFEVDGIPERREPPTVKAWGEVAFAAPGALLSDKGFQWLSNLDDREITPRMHEKGKAEDSFDWDLNCTRPGVYRVSFTVTAPYYGTREGQAFVISYVPVPPAATPAVTANTAGGDGGRVAAGGAAGAQVTSVTGGANTSTTAAVPPPTTTSSANSGPISSVACPGYGFSFGMKDGRITVISVEPGSFAAQVGIKVGWKLKQADGQDAVGMALRQLLGLMTPPDKHPVELDMVTQEGTDVTITLRQP